MQCCSASSHPGGIVDLHLCQQFSINAEVAEAPSLIVDNAVAFTGHRDEPGVPTVIRSLQSPQKVPSDGVDQAWTLCPTKTHNTAYDDSCSPTATYACLCNLLTNN